MIARRWSTATIGSKRQPQPTADAESLRLGSNHYHLALRTGVVSLDRPFRSLQQRVTRGINARAGVYGPLWQSRYKAKLVNHQRYLDQLLIYIHLNPVDAGIVRDPALYAWSGHNELLGQVKDSIVDIDEVLRVFGNSRRSARTPYRPLPDIAGLMRASTQAKMFS